MPELSIYQIFTMIGMVLPLLLVADLSNIIKKVVFAVSTVCLVVGLGINLPWSIAVIFLSFYLSALGMKEYFYNYIFILIISFGDWSNPGLSEVFLTLLSLVMHTKFEDREAKFILPVFSITLMFYLINASSLSSTPAISFSLLICISLLFVNIFSQDLRLVDTFSMFSTVLFTILMKTIVEQNITQLSISMYNAWYSFNVIIVFYVLIRTLIKYKKDLNIKNNFLKILVITFYFPTFVSLTPVSAIEASSFAVMILVGATLYLKQKNETLIDSVLSMLLGIILICLQIYFTIGLDVQGVVLLAMSISLSSQFFYLIKSVEYRQLIPGRFLYRERLPQLAFISIVFGWICTLWYILYYVRKIQG